MKLALSSAPQRSEGAGRGPVALGEPHRPGDLLGLRRTGRVAAELHVRNGGCVARREHRLRFAQLVRRLVDAFEHAAVPLDWRNAAGLLLDAVYDPLTMMPGEPTIIGLVGGTVASASSGPSASPPLPSSDAGDGKRATLRAMTLPVTLDYGLAMNDGVGAGGLTDEELAAAAPRFADAVAAIAAERDAGRQGFWDLPTDRTALDAIDRYVDALPTSIDEVILLGIGGSSLGARAVATALGGPELARATPRRLHLPDNSDPWALAAMLEALDPARTLVIVVSKSGGTVETAAQMLVVRAWLDQALGADQARAHLVLVTDPATGALRQLATEEQIQAFDIPANVGGRFSVLTGVGLLPARLLGLDASGMLDGAAQMAAACATPKLPDNPAGLLATLHVLHHRLRGHHIHVLMPYADALRPFAAWYVQLWAESLGKRTNRQGEVVETGPTPLPAIGATDQHAQMQLFMEGPRDKLVTFLGVRHTAKDLTIPAAPEPFAYLGGKRLSTVLDAELRGTRLALARDGRPSMSLEVDQLTGETLGALLFLYEAATAFAGELLDIDAFNQPGVELGKQLACGVLGRPGHEAQGHTVIEAEKAQSTRYAVGR